MMVDVSTLPKREELDPEMPFEHLFSQWPSIRPFLYLETDEATGKRYLCIRGSLPPEYIGVAQDILRKYKPRQRVTADVQELQEVIP
ncbi:MAG: hypothetical protein GWN87_28535 [Desulfuromonadales bacterium]|nr:hypothetical protein [Desulfuromonadales bacterium]